MSRLARPSPAALDPEQRALYDAIAGGPRARGPQHFALTADDGGLLGPFNALLLSPALGTALQQVGSAVRFSSALPARIREAAILLVATAWDSAFERMAHEAVGRDAGLSEDDLAALRRGEVPASADDAERAHLEVTRALLRGDLSDEEWGLWTPVVGDRAVFELTTLVGYYATLALQLRVFRVGLPDTRDPIDISRQSGDDS
jgi:4-carboxymuconolactone decarboxylase